jgi:hypothetical protein
MPVSAMNVNEISGKTRIISGGATGPAVMTLVFGILSPT